MYELPHGIKPITHLIRWPEEAMIGDRVRMKYVVPRGLNGFFPRSHQVAKKHAITAVPNDDHLSFERKCQMWHAYNTIALRVQHLVRRFQWVRLVAVPWARRPEGKSEGLITTYAFSPTLPVFRREVDRGDLPEGMLWRDEPVRALSDTVEWVRSRAGFYHRSIAEIERDPFGIMEGRVAMADPFRRLNAKQRTMADDLSMSVFGLNTHGAQETEAAS